MLMYSAPGLLKQVALAALYVVAAVVGKAVFGGNDLVLFVWLVLGLSAASVYVAGNRMLAGVFVGTLAGYLSVGHELLAAFAGTVRHIIVLYVGVWLLRRKHRFDPALGKPGDYLRILGVACVLGVVGASLTEAQSLLDASAGNFTALQFFAGVMLSTLVGVPFFLVWRHPPRHWASRQAAMDAVLILGLTVVVGQIVFLDWLKETVGQVARGYWMFLFVTWAAVRLGPHGAVFVIALTTLQALIGAHYGTGFFANDISKTHLSNYYFYMLCLSAVGMTLATYFAQRQQAMRALDAKVTELDRLNAELLRKNQEMESMIYVTSHDLRSPLVNIQGFSQRLEKSAQDIVRRLAQDDVPDAVRSDLAKPLIERIPTALGFIKSSSLKMDALISGLLRLSRTGRAQLSLRPLDMNALLTEIRGTLTIQAQQAQATIAIERLPECLGDAEQLNQVFTNLIDNAIKYRDPARPLTVRISGEELGARVRYVVADTGCGIAPEHQDKVWALFHRIDPTGPVAGEGLGLTLVRRILDRMQGEIRLESSLGQGSRFIIELPAAHSPGAPNDPRQ